MKRFVLGFAIVEFIVLLVFFGQYYARRGSDLHVLFGDAATPDSTASLSDLLLSVPAARALALQDGLELGGGRFGVVLTGVFVAGLSFCLPLCLYWRKRRPERAPAATLGTDAASPVPSLELPNPEHR